MLNAEMSKLLVKFAIWHQGPSRYYGNTLGVRGGGGGHLKRLRLIVPSWGGGIPNDYGNNNKFLSKCYLCHTAIYMYDHDRCYNVI